MKLVLTGVNFKEEAKVYKQPKKGLAKDIAGRGQSTDSPAIKLEGAFMAEKMDSLEEIFLSECWSKPGGGAWGGGVKRGGEARGGFSGASSGVVSPRTQKTPRGTP